MNLRLIPLTSLLCACCMLCACGAPADAAASSVSSPASVPVEKSAVPVNPVAQQLAKMTLREKVGQMFFIRPDALDPALTQEQIDDAESDGVQAVSDAMRQTLLTYPVGGVALFGKNIANTTQLPQFIAELQAASSLPLFVGIDEEGGRVARIANHPAFTVPQYESAQAVGSTGNTEDVRNMGATIGGYLRPYGFNLDFAPDADVNTNPGNPVIGDRAFSSDPQQAAILVATAVTGFHDAGMLCCLKHFPGHGDTATDTHEGYAQSDKSWEDMLACELLPFKSGIAAGADMVMVAHITTPNATDDDLPASLSQEMVTGKLRTELGYSGVIITDSLAMGAITKTYTPAQSAVMAVEAGVDILLMPTELPAAFDGVMQAVADGTLSEQRIDESVSRILALKMAQGLL